MTAPMPAGRPSAGAGEDACSGNRLTEMARRVFGGMKDEAANCRWQRSAADVTRRRQPINRCRAQLIERRIDRPVNASDDFGQRLPRLFLGPQELLLRIAERFTSCIRQQPIERAARVTQVETDRCRSARPLPHVRFRDSGEQAMQVFTHLQQRMYGRHHQGVVPVDRSAQPDLRSFHVDIVAPKGTPHALPSSGGQSMAEPGSNDTPRRYEETTEPQNPPNSVLNRDARRAAVLSYFVPVVVLFVVIGVALVYWSNQPAHSRSEAPDQAEVGTAGRTDGGQPEPKADSPRDEIKYRGDDLSPIRQVSELRDVDARQMTGRQVSIAEAEVDSASGTTLWIREDDRKFAVIAPEGAPAVKPGATVSITGRVAADANGELQIRADRIQQR